MDKKQERREKNAECEKLRRAANAIAKARLGALPGHQRPSAKERAGRSNAILRRAAVIRRRRDRCIAAADIRATVSADRCRVEGDAAREPDAAFAAPSGSNL